MAVEIEAKMRVDDFAGVRTALQAHGADRVAEALETNTFFDTPDRALLGRGSGLRLRINRYSDGRQTFVVTFKGPLRSGELKTREEIELVVDNPNNAVELFSRLGYTRELSFEKRRESWELENCQVELDELPYLGKFVEIEGPNEPAVLRLRDKLELGNASLVNQGYISLLSEYLKIQGIGNREITFATS